MLPDWFAARFIFYLAVPTAGNYSFWIWGDDTMQMWVNDGDAMRQMPGAGGRGPFPAVLPAGFSKLEVVFSEWTGWAYSAIGWDAGTGSGTWVDLPWSQVLPFLPGTPLPVNALVNGVPAVPACPGGNTIDLSGAGAAQPGEMPVATLPGGGQCSFVYSSFRTPTLTTWVNPASTLPSPPTTLTLTGNLLGGLAAANYSATVGGAAASIASVTGNATVQSVAVGLPPLPAGTYPVLLGASGFGYARNAPGTSPDVRTKYPLSLSPSGIISLPAVRASVWGGLDVTLRGSGFVPTDPALTYGKAMVLVKYSGPPAMNNVSYRTTVLSANATVLTLRLHPW